VVTSFDRRFAFDCDRRFAFDWGDGVSNWPQITLTAFDDEDVFVTSEASQILDKMGIKCPFAFPETNPTPPTDTSANPSHYDNFDIAPVDLIDCYNLNFFEGNVVKYVSRARHKNGREDLLKALWYLLWALGFPKKNVIELVKQIEGDLGS